MGMKMQLKVLKTDGSVEDYLHTKVLGTISNVFSVAGISDNQTAEELAEVLTYYFYRKQHNRMISSSDIFSAVKVVLSATENEEAAVILNEYHHQRRIRRNRVEVVSVDVDELTDAEMMYCADRSRWDKSIMIEDLVSNYSLDRQAARMIGSMAEEKILNMGINPVSTSLIKQVMLGDCAAVMRAERQLQTA